MSVPLFPMGRSRLHPVGMSSTPLWLPLAAAGIAVLGTLGGVLTTQRSADRREDKTWRRERETEHEDQWVTDRRSYYLPLREAANDLKTRLEHLARIYRREPDIRAARHVNR